MKTIGTVEISLDNDGFKLHGIILAIAATASANSTRPMIMFENFTGDLSIPG